MNIKAIIQHLYVIKTAVCTLLAACTGAILVMCPLDVYAMPACPLPSTITQPDGTQAIVYLRGDEHAHWNEDRDGYLVQRDKKSGHWVYANEEGGVIKPTSHRLGKTNPKAVGIRKPNISKIMSVAPSSNSSFTSSSSSTPTANAAATTGVMKNLVVLVNFSDLSIPAPPDSYDYTLQKFDDLFNKVGYNYDGAVGSVKDYYLEVSNNALTLESTVVEPVTLDYGYAHYGADSGSNIDVNAQSMVSEALAKMDARGFDFRTVDGNNDGWVDGLTIIHAGRGQEYSGNDTNYIWSHKWSLNSWVRYDGKKLQEYHTEPAQRGRDGDANIAERGITRIGVICHENGHFLGLPDLYDTDGGSSGLGYFCLMASGCWGSTTGSWATLGNKPVHMSAWCKDFLGWVNPTLISSSGYYSIGQVETNQQVYKLQNPSYPKEYYLLENRQGVGFDASLPGSTRGMLIWHIDDNKSNNTDPTHYWVDLEEASGTQDLQQAANVRGDDADYFRSNTLTSFTASTNPNDLLYSGTALGWPIVGISTSGPAMSFYAVQGSDTTPPTANTPTDSGAYTANASIAFQWAASTDLSGIQSYNCRIGTAAGASDVFTGSVGNVLTKSITGTIGKIYYCSVQAIDNFGNIGNWSASSDGIALVNNSPISISTARTKTDNTSVGLSSKKVTAVFGDCYYIEEDSRTSGIKVIPTITPIGLSAGALVDVGGTIMTGTNGERYISGTMLIH